MTSRTFAISSLGLLVIPSLLIVGACLALSGVFVHQQVQGLEQSLRDRGLGLVRLLAREAELGVMGGDAHLLRSLGEVFLAQRDAAYVEFRDVEGHVLDSSGSRAGGPVGKRRRVGDTIVTTRSDRLEFVHPIVAEASEDAPEEIGFADRAPHERERIGVAVIGLSLRTLLHRRATAIRTATILVTLVTLIAVTSVWLLLRRRVGQLVATAEIADEQKRLADLMRRIVIHASHEFRTPLTVIQAATDVLRRYGDRLPPARRVERLDKIQTAIGAMTALMDDVVMFGKTGSDRCTPRPVDVADLCAQVVSELPDEWSQRIRRSPDPMPPVAVDARLVRRMLRSVLDNACRYSSDDAPVVVTASAEGRRLTIRVEDRGTGIPASDLAHIFEPFHRGANVEARAGAGLGLASAKIAADLHRGAISVESVEGQGSTFTIDLPAEPADNYETIVPAQTPCTEGVG